jgi:CheY-like chemotaxis protein
LAARLLALDGYQVLEARNGEEALQVAADWPGVIDLLLTDLVMPRMNGRELAVALTERRPGLKVIFMSGYPADTLGPGQGLPLDPPVLVSRFLQKPFDSNGLLHLVRIALAPAGPA